MFQVISIEDENNKTYKIDCGIHFENLREVIEHIGFNPDDHDYEEV
ncbi:MAG: hypothetical protein WBG30_07010 [Psychrilyobacter sp.]